MPEPFQWTFPGPAVQEQQVVPDKPPEPKDSDLYCDYCGVYFDFGEPVLDVFDGIIAHSKKDNKPIVENFAQGQGRKLLHPTNCFQAWYVKYIDDTAFGHEPGVDIFCAACDSKLFGSED